MVDFWIVYFESTSVPFSSLSTGKKSYLINVWVYMDASFRTIQADKLRHLSGYVEGTLYVV